MTEGKNKARHDETENSKVTVKAPFMGLTPIPSLQIDRVDVDFQMEVTDTDKVTDNKSSEVSTNISSTWFDVNVGISGKVSSSRENGSGYREKSINTSA